MYSNSGGVTLLLWFGLPGGRGQLYRVTRLDTSCSRDANLSRSMV